MNLKLSTYLAFIVVLKTNLIIYDKLVFYIFDLITKKCI